MFLKESLETLFDAHPKAVARLRQDLANGGHRSFIAFSVLAVADDVSVEYLPAAVARDLGEQIKRSAMFNTTDKYFVADKIVRARRIACFMGTNHMTEGRLDQSRFDDAVHRFPHVFKRNGVYTATFEWSRPQAVAVGYSILPINRTGEIWSGRGGLPTTVEPMLARTTRVSGLVTP